ncbi:hypothetical protein BDF21DRAFT_419727 [Thamnidium elegans]|nr:hypothetical protein BDF21DRAFT_419727 [Thamnidium elegans]
MSYNSKRFKRQEDDNNHLPQVFQRLGSSPRPNNTTITYTSRTQRNNEGGGAGLRIARYNSLNSNSPQQAYPDYSKISQLRDDAVHYAPNNKYVYNQPIQTPTNNFRFVRSDASKDVSRLIISFLRDSPVSSQPQSPPSPSYNYNNMHHNNRRVINEHQQDHLYQEQQQQEDMQEQTYNDRINIDIAKKIRITASIPTSNMSNDHVDSNAVGSNINNNKQLITPKRQVTVATPRKDRSSSSERQAVSKRARVSSPASRTKRTRSPSPLSETGRIRRPRRSSVGDYGSDEDIPFLILKSDTYIPNYAKEDNINNRLSGAKKFKDLRSYPPLGSTATEAVSHNKVWKKPESSPLPLSKKFTPGATKTVDVTRSNTKLTPNFNTNQETMDPTKVFPAPTKKHTAPSVKPVATSAEHANAPTKVGTTAVKPVTAKSVTTKRAATPSKPAAAPFNRDAASSNPVTASSKQNTSPVKSAIRDTPDSTSTTSVTASITTSVKPTFSPKKPAETSIDTPINPVIDTSSKNKLAEITDKPVKPVLFAIKPASKLLKPGTEAKKAFIEKDCKLKEVSSRWDTLPSKHTDLEKQDNVADNNNTVYSDTSVSTVKHGIDNQSKYINTATGSFASQGVGIQKSSNEPTSTPSTEQQNQDDAFVKQQEGIKQDERARNLLRQVSIDEREDVVMDIEPPPAGNRPAPILNIHNQCKRYQPPVITILKDEPLSDHDMSPVENEQDPVYDSLTSVMQNTVNIIMGEFIETCAEEAEKKKHVKKLPDIINTQEPVLLNSSNEQAQQLISPPVSSNTETSPVVLPIVTDKPKAIRSRLPAPWKVRMTDSGDIFYLNSVTGETTPTRPV